MEDCEICEYRFKCNIKKIKERKKIFNENSINKDLVRELFQERYNL